MSSKKTIPKTSKKNNKIYQVGSYPVDVGSIRPSKTNPGTYTHTSRIVNLEPTTNIVNSANVHAMNIKQKIPEIDFLNVLQNNMRHYTKEQKTHTIQKLLEIIMLYNMTI